jgi:hypothetical protein
MEQAEKERLEAAAINAAIAEALLAAGTKTPRVLTPYVRAALKVRWDGDNPMVVAQLGNREVTPDAFVAHLKADDDFKQCFHQPLNPDKKDGDGIRRIDVRDQASLNKYSAEIAAGTAEVVYPEETRKKLDETEIDLRDQASLDANLEAIASGEKTVRY